MQFRLIFRTSVHFFFCFLPPRRVPRTAGRRARARATGAAPGLEVIGLGPGEPPDASPPRGGGFCAPVASLHAPGRCDSRALRRGDRVHNLRTKSGRAGAFPARPDPARGPSLAFREDCLAAAAGSSAGERGLAGPIGATVSAPHFPSATADPAAHFSRPGPSRRERLFPGLVTLAGPTASTWPGRALAAAPLVRPDSFRAARADRGRCGAFLTAPGAPLCPHFRLSRAHRSLNGLFSDLQATRDRVFCLLRPALVNKKKIRAPRN
jgi:hypothetical protein